MTVMNKKPVGLDMMTVAQLQAVAAGLELAYNQKDRKSDLIGKVENHYDTTPQAEVGNTFAGEY